MTTRIKDAPPEEAEQQGTFKPDGSLENPPAVLENNRPAFVEEMDDEGLRPMDYYLNLAQSVSQVVKDGERQAGDFHIDGHPSQKQVTLLPLGYMRKRTLWEDGMPVCRSYDGKEGEGDPGGTCEGCSYAEWQVNARTGKVDVPPDCKESRSFQCFALEWGRVVIWDVPLTTKAKRTCINRIRSWHEASGGLGHYGFKVSSFEVKGSQGTYLEPKVSLVEITDEILAQLPRKAEAPEELPF